MKSSPSLNRDVYCLGLYVPSTSAVEVLNAGKSQIGILMFYSNMLKGKF
jgi:hypothetical protein